MTISPTELRTSALMRRCAAVMKAAVPGVQALADELIKRAIMIDVMNPVARGLLCSTPKCERCEMMRAIGEILPEPTP